MKTVLVKRSIEKDGLPKNEGKEYIVIQFHDRNPKLKWRAFAEFKKGKFSIPDVIHWYEELPLSQLIEDSMPTEEFDKWLHEKHWKWERAQAGHFMWFKEIKIGNDNRGKTTRELLDEWLKNKLTDNPI